MLEKVANKLKRAPSKKTRTLLREHYMKMKKLTYKLFTL